MSRDFTRSILNQFTREWEDGGETIARIEDFAKRENLSLREVLWICVNFSSHTFDNAGFDEYFDAWKSVR